MNKKVGILISTVGVMALTVGTARAQSSPAPVVSKKAPGMGGSSANRSNSGATGEIVFACVFGMAFNTINTAWHTGKTQRRQLTLAEAPGVAVDGCLPGVGTYIVRPMMPRENRATIAISEEAWRYYETREGKERLWMCARDNSCDSGLEAYAERMKAAYRLPPPKVQSVVSQKKDKHR